MRNLWYLSIHGESSFFGEINLLRVLYPNPFPDQPGKTLIRCPYSLGMIDEWRKVGPPKDTFHVSADVHQKLTTAFDTLLHKYDLAAENRTLG